jgi:hypothetical protein
MQSTIVPLTEPQRAAHRGAHYHAATPRSMPLRVDVHSTDLTQLMRKRFVQTAALLTAHNPAGKKQTPAKNKKANAALLARIEALGLGWLPGHRKAFKDGDPDEEGYLVFDISGGQLEALMVEFDQEVALWCPSSGTPVLMLHPRARRNYSAAELAWEKLMKESGSTVTVSRAPKQDAGNNPVKADPAKGTSSRAGRQAKLSTSTDTSSLDTASIEERAKPAKSRKPAMVAVPAPVPVIEQLPAPTPAAKRPRAPKTTPPAAADALTATIVEASVPTPQVSSNKKPRVKAA